MALPKVIVTLASGQDCEVKVEHLRLVEFEDGRIDYAAVKVARGPWRRVLPCGGSTTVYLRFGDREGTGFSICSRRDNFCKAKGRELALARALVSLAKGGAIEGPYTF